MEMTLVLFYCIVPILALGIFAVTLVNYLLGRQKNKKTPGSVSADVMKMRKIWLVVASVVLGVLLLVVLGFMGLMMMAVAFM